MRLISRDKPGPVPEPAADDLDEDLSGWLRYRWLVIRVLVAGFVLSPAVSLLVAHGLALTGWQAFLVLGTGAFAVLVDQTVLVTMAVPAQPPSWHRATLPVTIALGGALFAVGQMGWLTALAVASAASGAWPPAPGQPAQAWRAARGSPPASASAKGSATATRSSPSRWSCWRGCWLTAPNAATSWCTG